LRCAARGCDNGTSTILTDIAFGLTEFVAKLAKLWWRERLYSPTQNRRPMHNRHKPVD